MREFNVFAQSYQMMGEELEKQRRLEMESDELLPELQLVFTSRPDMDRRRYNTQRINEVAAVFSTTADGEIPESYVTIRNKNTKTLQKVSIMDPNVEPWIYPLFYPYGTQGWHRDLKKLNSDRRITRGHETYQGLRDYLQTTANNLNGRIGKMIVLPSTFTGSPRNMLQNYQDAMAIVSKFGKPDLFITMTCNPKWREIEENLLPGQQASDRSDICALMKHMIHGPCGDWCLIDGRCSKHYPKPFLEETKMDEDAYPYYRRRNNGTNFERPGGYVVDNRHDVAAITIEPVTECVVIDHDEIHNYIEARYVGPVEASWRILSKKLQDKSHAITRLPVHLPNEQNIIIENENIDDAMTSALDQVTMLIDYFSLNLRDEEAKQYLYIEIPIACLALGLIEDDDEWKKAMNEAVGWMMPRQLRRLFVRILLHCQPLHPEELWENFKVAMSEDYIQHFGILQGQNKAYVQINSMLRAEGKSFVDFPQMKQLTENDEEENCMIFEEAMEIGGSATLLPFGKTVHKIFGLPVPLFADSSSSIKIQSKEAQYLKEIDIFIWDEAPMAPRYALEIMDRTLRDIMNNDIPFGGKIVLLGGDFRQLLPIKVHATRTSNADIVEDIYGDLIRKKEFVKMSKCAILSGRNVDVDEINKKVVELLDINDERIYTSVDTAVNNDNGDMSETLLPEYLNSLSPSSLPSHELRLRPNSIIMLIRNLSINGEDNFQ
ncbi:uncharacterized protein LOC112637334 [Camponotus floridanus]|uniref:uncharacterized protein LOC112637334 n=1 Tax=Camponotus floridanus TaxID=104421 RepID=UPI000DC6BFC5|nr:uncharacterized protein LOC112637334 [Camponotus floridanus]